MLDKTNTWTPNAGDSTAPGTQTLRAERTKLGLVAVRRTVRGRPVIFTTLRSTYFHEVDSAAGFMDFNDPAAVRDPESFKRAAAKIGYTFNWFIVNWNNKQARGYRSADEQPYSSAYRSLMLEDRVRAAIAGPRKLTLPGLIDAMEVAGTGDMRAHVDLPLALRILGRPRDPALRRAVAELRAWRADGGLRRDANRDGVYEHSDAIRIVDAWWPRRLRAQFEPVLGKTAYERLIATIAIDNPPNGGGDHHGSAYQGAWFGYVRKDLRTVLGRRVRGPYARRYCGRGSLSRCRAALQRSLAAALKVPASELYGNDQVCADAGKAGDQWCYDSVRQRPIGGATQPLIAWVNRPTFQQANEIQPRVGR